MECCICTVIVDSLYCDADHPYPHSFPTRRSSDLKYPMETVPDETHDHPHHRGLWFTHGDVNGYDFWGNEPSEHNAKAGKVDRKSTRLNSSHGYISYAVFRLKKKNR